MCVFDYVLYFIQHGHASTGVQGASSLAGAAVVAPPVPGVATPTAPSAPAAAAPVSSSALPPPPSDAESQAVVAAMNGMLGALSETPLSAPEKKMLGDVTKVRYGTVP